MKTIIDDFIMVLIIPFGVVAIAMGIIASLALLILCSPFLLIAYIGQVIAEKLSNEQTKSEDL